MKTWHNFGSMLRLALAASVLVGVITFLLPYFYADVSLRDLSIVVLCVTLVIAIVVLATRFGLVILSGATFVAYLAGLAYSLKLLFTSDVSDVYPAAVLTVVAFSLHGFAIGAFIEIVTLLHRVTGRGMEIFKEKTAIKLKKE